MATYRYNLGTANRDVELGVAANDKVAFWVIQVTGTIGTGVIAVKGYVQGTPVVTNTTPGGAALTTANAIAVAYHVGLTGTLTSGATTISVLGVYRIIADGMSIVLSYTAGGGSDLVVHATPVDG